MAVAAYSSVLSLMLTVDNALHPFHSRHLPNTAQIQTLQGNLASLRDVLEKLPSKINKEIEDLARPIPEITNEVDDIIDNYMVDRKIGSHNENEDHDVDLTTSSFCRDIDSVIQNIGSINQNLTMMLEDHKMGISYQNLPKVRPLTSSSSSEAGAASDKSGTVIGLEKPLLLIMEKLDGQHERNLQVIPIVGMAGIGKTTLARYAFDNKCIQENFTISIWLTISQDCDVRQILKGLLNDGVIGINKNKASAEDAAELGLQLYQKLFGRKYLVVMDDVWSTQAWDDLRPFFPDNGNGSRIIVTTRLSVIANSLGSRNVYTMGFLDEDSSWDLFSKRAFARGSQSPELRAIGKKILKSCKGLPLGIAVIGGMLANSDMIQAYREIVARNVNSYANLENNENCLNILSLSYNCLHIHLKSCFLYMANFPEDMEVKVSYLIKLWIAEGFVKPVRDKTLEEAARDNLKDLIDRNLIDIRGRGTQGNINRIGIHDLLRDLCVREYYKEQFLSVPRIQKARFHKDEKSCFLCGKVGNLSEVNLFCLPPKSDVRLLVCNSCRVKYPQLIRLRFVRLIGATDGEPKDIPQSTKSRYVQISDHSRDYIEFVNPASMNLLWNLQNLVIKSKPFDGPNPFSKMWEMPQLRYLNLDIKEFPYPPKTNDFTILENLQSRKVANFRCTEEVTKRIPNLKKLCLSYMT